MKIEIVINNEKRIFKVGFISGWHMRTAVQLQQAMKNKGFSVEVLDEIVGFVVEVFDNQFTIEEFYKGLANNKIFDVAMGVILACINGEADTE